MNKCASGDGRGGCPSPNRKISLAHVLRVLRGQSPSDQATVPFPSEPFIYHAPPSASREQLAPNPTCPRHYPAPMHSAPAKTTVNSARREPHFRSACSAPPLRT